MRSLFAFLMGVALIAPTTVEQAAAVQTCEQAAAVQTCELAVPRAIPAPSLRVADESCESASPESRGSESQSPGDPERDEGEESSANEEDSGDSKLAVPVPPGDAAFPSLRVLPLMGSLVGLGPRLGHETELERPPRA